MKLAIRQFLSLQNEISFLGSLNAQLQAIQTSFQNTLSRDGTSPNSMSADLDMNSNNILNLPEPASLTEPVRLQDIQNYGGGFAFVPKITGLDIGKLIRVRADGLGYEFTNMVSDVSTNQLYTTTNDSTSLGKTGLGFSDLFLASGAIIDFASGNVVLTHSSGILTVTTGDLRVTSAGTNAASVALVGGTQTLTNKTVNLTSNTLTGTTAQFNTALSDNDFATLAGTETLTNKTINLASNTITGTTAQFNTALSDNDFATLAGAETLTNKTLTSPVINTPTLTVNDNVFTVQDQTDTTKKFQFEVSGVTTGNTRILTIPNTSDTLVTLALAQTLTNKTLTTPVIAQIVNSGTLTLPTSTDTLVARATTDTLTNKTLTSPVIATIVNSGTLTLPTSTDTLVGRATTDTLTNKSIDLTSNTLSGTTAQFNAALSGDDFATLTNTVTLTNKTLTSPALTSPTTTGTADTQQVVKFSGFISAALSANTNDWAPSGITTASCILVTASSTWQLTGLSGGSAGRLMFIFNADASNTFTIKNNSASSSAANRIQCNADLNVAPGNGCLLYYETTSNFWRLVGGGGGGGGSITNAYASITDGTTTANAVGTDTVKFRANTGLKVAVGSNDVTHGDNVLYDYDINALTVDSSPDINNDYTVTYDASATAHKKVLLTNFDTPASILSKLLTVDGSGSGLDADTLDGHDTTFFYSTSNPPPSWALLSTLTTTSGTTQSATSLPACSMLMIVVDGVSFTGSSALNMALSLNNGVGYTTANTIAPASGAAAGIFNVVLFMPLTGGAAAKQIFGSGATATSALDLATGTPFTLAAVDSAATGAVNAIRFAGGTFDAGTISIYGM